MSKGPAIAQGRAARIAPRPAVRALAALLPILNASSRACRGMANPPLPAALLPSLALYMWAGALPAHAQQPPAPSCIDVQVQGARSLSFDCLNQTLKADAQQPGDAPPTVTAKDVTGAGAPTTVGAFSYTGTAIRMGNAFGHSAIPQRPAPPSFTNALLPAGGK